MDREVGEPATPMIPEELRRASHKAKNHPEAQLQVIEQKFDFALQNINSCFRNFLSRVSPNFAQCRMIVRNFCKLIRSGMERHRHHDLMNQLRRMRDR